MTGVGSALAEARAREWLERLDARVKLTWLACLSVIAVTVDSTPALCVLFTLGGAPLLALRLRPAGWLAIGGVLAMAAWSTVTAQALFYSLEPRTPLATIVVPFSVGDWEFGGLILWREGAFHGLLQSMRLLAMCQAGLAVCLSTSPSRLLEGMTRAKLPRPIAFVAVSALRALPEVVREFALVRQARRLRGAGRQGPGAWKGVRELTAAAATLEPVLARGLRRAAALATSVTLRGFDPAATARAAPPLTRPAAAGMGAMVALAMTIASLKTIVWLENGGHDLGATLHAAAAFAREWL